MRRAPIHQNTIDDARFNSALGDLVFLIRIVDSSYPPYLAHSAKGASASEDALFFTTALQGAQLWQHIPQLVFNFTRTSLYEKSNDIYSLKSHGK